MTSIRLATQSLALVACLAFLAPTAAPAKEKGTDRPFSGSATGGLVATDEDTGELILDYVGIATHLGKFTRRELATVDPDHTLFGTQIWTAANGDELHLTFDGVFITETEATGVYVFEGGSGCFADASGEATFFAVAPDLFHVSISFEGTLSY